MLIIGQEILLAVSTSKNLLCRIYQWYVFFFTMPLEHFIYPLKCNKKFHFFSGTSICTGDSGGGMYIDHDETWYLRGVVSAAVYIPTTMICHASHYVIFTDVMQNLNWIKDIIK